MIRNVSPPMLVIFGLVAIVATWSATAPPSRAVAQAIPSIPPQDCGGEANGNGVLQGGVAHLGSNTSLWQRATVVVFPSTSQSGQSYLQSIQQIVGYQPNVQPLVSPSPNAEASAIALANNNTGLNTQLHFASIHQGGQYNGGFHCTGLATGTYTVVATVYRNVTAKTFAQKFYNQTGGANNGGIQINASDPNLQSGFTPTCFYEVPAVYVNSGKQQNTYVTQLGGGAKVWTVLGSHPYGYATLPSDVCNQ